jgi:hypothetical protein
LLNKKPAFAGFLLSKSIGLQANIHEPCGGIVFIDLIL